MKFDKKDLAHSRNMLKVLGKGKWELDGMEILAFSEMMRWFSAVQRTIETEIAIEEQVAAQKLKEGQLVAKPVEDPIKTNIASSPSTAPKVSKKAAKEK